MAIKYSVENLQPNVRVRNLTPDLLKKDTALLDKLISLWGQLEAAEEVYDKPFGVQLPEGEQVDATEFFRKRLLKSSGYIITADNECVGMALTKQAEYSNAYFISCFVIDENHRGKHYGTTLLTHILKDKRNQKALLRVSLNNKAGLALYKSVGFVPMTQVMIKK